MTHILQELSFYFILSICAVCIDCRSSDCFVFFITWGNISTERFSFIGDGLSHVAFGAMAVATIFKLVNNTIFIMPVTIAAAILLLRTGQNTKIKGDAAIAMLSVSSLAVGYLVMNLFSTSANVSGDVCSTLFGSTTILTLTKTEVFTCIIMSILVVAFFILFYNRIFAVTFDENFTRAIGKNAETYNMIIAIITAVLLYLP